MKSNTQLKTATRSAAGQKTDNIVAAIQNGDISKYGELWKNVKSLVVWHLSHNGLMNINRADFDSDDLINSGYLAMVYAIKTYHPEKGAFSGWMIFYLKREIKKVTGIKHSDTVRTDAIYYSTSLDEPIGSNKEGDVVTLSEFLSSDEDIERDITERAANEDLKSALQSALTVLAPDELCVIKHKYYARHTISQTAKYMRISPEKVKSLHAQAINKLRKPKTLRTLSRFVEKKSIQSYNTSNIDISDFSSIRNQVLVQ